MSDDIRDYVLAGDMDLYEVWCREEVDLRVDRVGVFVGGWMQHETVVELLAIADKVREEGGLVLTLLYVTRETVVLLFGYEDFLFHEDFLSYRVLIPLKEFIIHYLAFLLINFFLLFIFYSLNN